ncbi:MAG: hypothetical protein JSR37_07205 [Verrucomicrobia bacterium]|nr:hypothetical protein [Verrucomicrobiota bacterium]MBS0636287.1 hypothetical protein [Verrucomicrobiota bacterium]
MKYSISRDQQFFFEQKKYIEFDGLLTPLEQKALQTAIKPGRNLSFKSDQIKAITHSRRLAKLAAGLTHGKFLRFGFDQLYTGGTEFCINGLVCLLFLEVDSDHAIFTTPTVDITTVPLKPDARYFLIGWADERAQYILQPNDPHTHDLKKLGYVFGDRLQEQWHPTLLR